MENEKKADLTNSKIKHASATLLLVVHTYFCKLPVNVQINNDDFQKIMENVNFIRTKILNEETQRDSYCFRKKQVGGGARTLDNIRNMSMRSNTKLLHLSNSEKNDDSTLPYCPLPQVKKMVAM